MNQANILCNSNIDSQGTLRYKVHFEFDYLKCSQDKLTVFYKTYIHWQHKECLIPSICILGLLLYTYKKIKKIISNNSPVSYTFNFFQFL